MPTVVIKYPENISVTVVKKDPQGNEFEVTQELKFLEHFLRDVIFADPRWGANTDWLFTGIEIRKTFAKAKPGEEVTLTHDQYTKLETVVKAPGAPPGAPLGAGGYNFEVAMQTVPFIDCILHPFREAA